MNVIYHPLAVKEIDSAFEYYQEILPSLARDFLEELNTSIESIVSSPLRYHLVRRDMRKCRLKRFPYALYFVLEEDTIRILIVRHNRRHPSYGMDRLDQS